MYVCALAALVGAGACGGTGNASVDESGGAAPPNRAAPSELGSGGGNSGTGGGGGDGSGHGSGGSDAGVGQDASVTGPLTLRIVQGDGALVLAGWPNIDPLIVELTQNGRPVAGTTVTFAPQGDVGVHPATAVTDASGRAETAPRGTQMSQPQLSFTLGSVTASIPSGQSVTFKVTTTSTGQQMFQPQIELQAPFPRDLGSGKVGDVRPQMVRVAVAAATGATAGAGIPNVGVRFVDKDDWRKAPAASCVGGTVFTGANGVVTCDVRFDRPGGGGLAVMVGGSRLFDLSAQIAP